MVAENFKTKMTLREMRTRVAARGILTVSELAAHIGCSRTSIYLAIERPSRFSRVFQKIIAVIEPNQPEAVKEK